MERSGIELASGPPKQDRRICQTDNLKEKAKKGDLYGKIIIYFRIGYRGTSR